MENNQVTELPDEVAVLVGDVESKGVMYPEVYPEGEEVRRYLLSKNSRIPEPGAVVVLKRTKNRPFFWRGADELLLTSFSITGNNEDVYLWVVAEEEGEKQ